MTGALVVSVYLLALAGFLGLDVISKVPPTLHRPLLAGMNAIAGVTLLGAIHAARVGGGVLGAVAVGLATVNVVGGFVATDRLLGASEKKKT